jgi:hypothetical protein
LSAIGAVVSSDFEIPHDAPVWIIGRSDLIRNKRATGRTQDLADAEFLEQLSD